MANNINYGDIWDSTKGYPGEGPAQTNGGKGKVKFPSKDRGDRQADGPIDKKFLEQKRVDKQTKRNKKVEQNNKIEKGNKLANNINYGDIWDSTKGYPGEGPAQTSGRMGKKNSPSKDRGDKKWQSCIEHWKEESKSTDKIMSDIHTIGNDLWYDTQ